MLLFEIFDRPYALVTGTAATSSIAEWFRANNVPVSQVYAAEEEYPKHLFITLRSKDGYWEVHHAYKTGTRYRSGIKLGLGDRAQPRYIATALQLYKQHLDRGHPIRIVASRASGMWPTYKRIIDRMLRGRQVEFIVGEPDPNYIGVGEQPSIAVTIEPRDSLMLEGYTP